MKLLHQDAPPETLAAVRAGVFGIWLFKTAINPLERLAALPADFIRPIGLLRLLPAAAWHALLTFPGLVALRVATIVCLTLAMLGRWRVPAALASAALLVLTQGMLRGVGYVNHTELVLLYAAMILALAPLVDRRAALQADRRAAPQADRRAAPQADRRAAPQAEPAPGAAARSDLPLVLIAMILCFSYTFTGISRLVLGLPAVFHSDTILMWTLMTSHRTTDYRWEVGKQVLALSPPLRAGFAAGLVFMTGIELLAPCCLFSRRFRRAFVVVVVPFHLVVFLTMNILFWENLALFVLLFAPIPWGRLRWRPV